MLFVFLNASFTGAQNLIRQVLHVPTGAISAQGRSMYVSENTESGQSGAAIAVAGFAEFQGKTLPQVTAFSAEGDLIWDSTALLPAGYSGTALGITGYKVQNPETYEPETGWMVCGECTDSTGDINMFVWRIPANKGSGFKSKLQIYPSPGRVQSLKCIVQLVGSYEFVAAGFCTDTNSGYNAMFAVRLNSKLDTLSTLIIQEGINDYVQSICTFPVSFRNEKTPAYAISGDITYAKSGIRTKLLALDYFNNTLWEAIGGTDNQFGNQSVCLVKMPGDTNNHFYITGEGQPDIRSRFDNTFAHILHNGSIATQSYFGSTGNDATFSTAPYYTNTGMPVLISTGYYSSSAKPLENYVMLNFRDTSGQEISDLKDLRQPLGGIGYSIAAMPLKNKIVISGTATDSVRKLFIQILEVPRVKETCNPVYYFEGKLRFAECHNRYSRTISHLKIYDMRGKTLLETNNISNSASIDLLLCPGVYIAELQDSENKTGKLAGEAHRTKIVVP
ncbi:MAG: T9SS type A sorting domain-containing protein [Bacteroidota bacterium]